MILSETVRLIRIFVSCPGDVQDELNLLPEVVDRINRTIGVRAVRLEVVQWSRDVVPQIGPPPQDVVDLQTPAYGIYLGIMAHRFGTPTSNSGSGTESEFRDAFERWGKLGSPWILFYFSNADISPATADLEQLLLVQRFRKELESKGIAATYKGSRGTADAFFEKVEIHLRQLIERATTASLLVESSPLSGSLIVPSEYRAWLRTQCGEVELLGLRLKQGRTIKLNTVYVPLTVTLATGDAASARRRHARRRHRQARRRRDRLNPELLLAELAAHSLYVAGAPGSGKSTFCRWVAWLTCADEVPTHTVRPPARYAERLPSELRDRLPLLVRLREFWPQLPTIGGTALTSNEIEAALIRWIDTKRPGGLKGEVFKHHLSAGSALLMLDGVDEVPLSRGQGADMWEPRSALLSGLASGIPEWISRGNRLLVTSRPYGLTEIEAQRLGIGKITINPLPEDLQALLVQRWFRVLEDDVQRGDATATDMVGEIKERDWLEPLRTSPMMLTAMCVVYGEGKRLPQDRHELYARVVENVLHNRFPGDPVVIAAVRNRLSVVAHGMHTGIGIDESRRTPEAEATFRELDRMLQKYRDQSAFCEQGFVGAVEAREQLLSQTGLLLPRDEGRAGFYHFSVQEFLASERILDLEEGDLLELFSARSNTPEWRNTLSFLFGGLISRGAAPDRGVRLLTQLLEASEASMPGVAVVVAECLEILLGRGIRLQAQVEACFTQLCLSLIERAIPARDRWQLAVTMGRLGDPRIVPDLRQRGDAYVRVTPAKRGPGYHMSGLPEEIKGPARPTKTAFMLSRYPVTNSQYEIFMREGGYDYGRIANRQIWSKDGMAWLRDSDVRQPGCWSRARWNSPNQPVAGVSFWEAEAFCTWAGGRLPSTSEMDAAVSAAQLGNSGDKDWREGCNSLETGLGVTSPVGIFPWPTSRNYGRDLIGNVWEWCVPGTHDALEEIYPLFGGAWDCEVKSFSPLGYGSPNVQFATAGFRVVVDIL